MKWAEHGWVNQMTRPTMSALRRMEAFALSTSSVGQLA